MPLFQPKPSIHLSTDQEEVGSPVFPRKASNWSIPCCSHISLGKSGGTIQLPDDSDSDSADEDHRQPSLSPFHAYNQESQNGSLPNAFLEAQARSQTSLSRNPFARVSSSEEQYTSHSSRQTYAPEERQVDDFTPKVSGEEELANFTRSSFTRYDDERDWTETYKDDDDEDDEDEDNTKSIAKGIQTKNDEGYTGDNDTRTYVSEDTHVQANSMQNEHSNGTSTITTPPNDKEQEEEDIIPRIEEDVLHLIPLPELSNDTPPAMIHRKASFEKSMSKSHDHAALKKSDEQDKRKSSSSTTNEIGQIGLEQNHPLGTLDNEPQERKLEAKSLSSVKDDSRRASIAQSLLGDKLDDFTEKLAFIKKNIIMSIDSDDDEDEEEINTEKILQKMEQAKSNSAIATTSNQKPPPMLHRGTSSLMDAVPTIARFMNQIGGGGSGGSGGSSGGNMAPEASTSLTAQLSSSQTSTSSFSPSSLFSALAGPMPESSPSLTTNKNLNDKRSILEENEEGGQQNEELFDFNKVLEIGKNVKTFGEGFVGNGIRMFNDVATRMKTTVEEEQRRAAQTAAQREETTWSPSSTTNENEWMHNYL